MDVHLKDKCNLPKEYLWMMYIRIFYLYLLHTNSDSNSKVLIVTLIVNYYSYEESSSQEFRLWDNAVVSDGNCKTCAGLSITKYRYVYIKHTQDNRIYCRHIALMIHYTAVCCSMNWLE